MQNLLTIEKTCFFLSGSFQNEPNITVKVLYHGPKEMVDDVKRLLFRDTFSCDPIDINHKQQISKSRAEADLEIVHRSPWGFHSEKAGFPFKFWLEAKVGPKPSLDTIPPLTKDFRRALKKAQDLKLKVVQSRDMRDWQQWIEEMVIPTAKLRHGDHVAVPSQEELESLSREGVLHLLYADDQGPIAGGLTHLGRLNRTLLLWRVGMQPDQLRDPKKYKSLNVFLDYIAFQEAARLGAEWLSLGPTLARVDDGLFRYKKAWGATFTDDKTLPEFELHFLTDKKYKILKSMPIIGLKNGEPVLHLSGDEIQYTNISTWPKEFSDHEFPGLAGVWLHQTGQEPTFIQHPNTSPD